MIFVDELPQVAQDDIKNTLQERLQAYYPQDYIDEIVDNVLCSKIVDMVYDDVITKDDMNKWLHM